jgi:predicted nucleotidyltransferase
MIDFERELQAITQVIVRSYHPEEIILFGSAARGLFREGSDLDLLVIKETKKKPMERVREIINFLPHTVDTDIVVLTPSELAARKREHHYFLDEIVRDGRVLYRQTH